MSTKKKVPQRAARKGDFALSLPGIRISRPSYTFSLNYGFFRSYEHFKPAQFFNLDDFFKAKVADRNLLKGKAYFSTGYHELDEVLGGGFPLGSTVSIELDPHVNSKIPLAFLSRIIMNFASAQNPILIQSDDKTSFETMSRYEKSAGLEKNLINTIQSQSQSEKIRSVKNNKADRAELVQKEVLKIKKRWQEKMLLSILSAETLRHDTKIHSDKKDLDLLSHIRSNSDLTVLISRRASDSRHTFVSDMADIRLHILEIDGTLFIQSDTPWSHLYALTIPETVHMIELEPMV